MADWLSPTVCPREMFLVLLKDEGNFFLDLFVDVGGSLSMPDFAEKRIIEKGDMGKCFTWRVHPMLIYFCQELLKMLGFCEISHIASKKLFEFCNKMVK